MGTSTIPPGYTPGVDLKPEGRYVGVVLRFGCFVVLGPQLYFCNNVIMHIVEYNFINSGLTNPRRVSGLGVGEFAV